MKRKFSIAWQSSTQARKQRKFRFNAPMHIRHIFMSANLSKELRKKYARRSFPLRKGDTVLIMRGEFKKKKGKIADVNLYNTTVYVEGIQRIKRDGTKVFIPLQPSKVQIIDMNLDDRKRMQALQKQRVHKKKAEVKAPAPVQKPVQKIIKQAPPANKNPIGKKQ